MRRIIGAAAMMGLLAACQREVSVAEQTDPKAYLQALYQQVFSKPAKLNLVDDRAKIFDASTVRAMDGLTSGQRAVLDTNPLCACASWGKINPTFVITATGPDAVHADVAVEDQTFKYLRPVAIDLVREQGHWRIHDITSPFGESLRAGFQLSLE